MIPVMISKEKCVRLNQSGTDITTYKGQSFGHLDLCENTTRDILAKADCRANCEGVGTFNSDLAGFAAI